MKIKTGDYIKIIRPCEEVNNHFPQFVGQIRTIVNVKENPLDDVHQSCGYVGKDYCLEIGDGWAVCCGYPFGCEKGSIERTLEISIKPTNKDFRRCISK